MSGSIREVDPNKLDIAELFDYLDDIPEVVLDPIERVVGRNAEESLEMGNQALLEGDAKEAIEHLERHIEQGPDDVVAGHLALGAAYEYAGQVDEAMEQYRYAAESSPGPEPVLAISALLKQESKLLEAIREQRRAVDAAPENGFAHFSLAKSLKEYGSKEAALKEVTQAAACEPSQVHYYLWAGDLLVEMDQPGEALRFFRTALDLSPGDDYVYLRTAVAFWKAGRHDEAIRSIRLATELDPDNDLPHAVLEAMLTVEGRLEDAALLVGKVAGLDRYDREKLATIRGELSI